MSIVKNKHSSDISGLSFHNENRMAHLVMRFSWKKKSYINDLKIMFLKYKDTNKNTTNFSIFWNLISVTFSPLFFKIPS